MTREAAPLPYRPGDVLAGKYRIERLLGAGGMGAVVLATHLGLEERVAIKFLRPEVMHNANMVTRFVREARAAARIKGDHVVRMTDVATLEDGVPYIVMEYLEGADLHDILVQGGPLAIPDAVDCVLQACEGVAGAHVAGIVHRDLKPSNLFVCPRPDGTNLVKLLDFGISKVDTDARTGEWRVGAVRGDGAMTQGLMGSPLYMAPEQMSGRGVQDHRVDIWALGIILYELITGQYPFLGQTVEETCAQSLSAPPVPPSQRNPAVSPDLEHAILRCLEKQPDKRFGNVAELAEALAPVAPDRSRATVDRIKALVNAPRLVVPRVYAPVDRTGGLALPPLSSSSTIEGFGTTNGFGQRSHKMRYVVASITGVLGAVLIVLAVWWFKRQGEVPDAAAATQPAATDTHTVETAAPPAPPTDPEPADSTATATATATATPTATPTSTSTSTPTPTPTPTPTATSTPTPTALTTATAHPTVATMGDAGAKITPHPKPTAKPRAGFGGRE